MTREGAHDARRRRPLAFGHHWRLANETQAMSLVLAGLMVVFALSIAHDELVQEMIEFGWIEERFREIAEILFGIVVFAAWTGLILTFATLVRKAAPENHGDRTG